MPGFVPGPPVRHGGKVRAVRFQKEVFRGDPGSNLCRKAGVLERDDTRQGDIESQIDQPPGHGDVTRETMKDPFRRGIPAVRRRHLAPP